MKRQQTPLTIALVLLVAAAFSLPVLAQERAAVLAGAELTRIVPAAFYFQGQSAPTQIRNSAAARFGTNRFVIVGMVDTSGYSAEIRARYEGFFITDSAITVGGETLSTGAYGFGFSKEGKLNILDLAGNEVLSVAVTNDKELRRPRPLSMTLSGTEVRLYRGRDYVVIAAR
ncbi:MAG TPA: hypothetical protein VM941_06225 [Pyrinomonadaceae bacterium]|jgi:hypothetical protein|nr:hypothetical protein [Pyrinomonadaceae bacterium]